MGYNFPQPISEQIWAEKYRLVTNKPDIKDDEDVTDTWSRIARACADSPVKMFMNKKGKVDVEARFKRFFDVLGNFKFLPAGRITAGAGSGRNVTLFNCYVMGTIQDSLYSIFENLKEAALTMQQGGGIGYDFSPLRPKNSPVKHLDADASGPLTFMDVWDMMCKTIMSAGSRRGAMMATMICTHPDIIRFITAKHDPLKLRMFNVSVMCTDDFMTAVREDAEWILKHKSSPAKPLAIDGAFHDADGNHYYEVVRAKDIWNLIMQNTYDHAEPGVLFIDRINKRNNLWYYEYISSTNPCVSGDTPILTENGWEEIQNLVGKKTKVWNGSAFSEVVPQITGHNRDMVTVFLSDGSQLRCTTNHKFITENGERIEAQHLKTDQKLQKSLWPIISGTEVLSLDYYGQGFFSGDGWVKESTQGQYIGLYGEKKNINHQWNEQSRSTYAINGGYQNTDTSQTKEYLFFRKGTFKSKDFVPFNSPIDQKRQWLAGLADADGTVTFDGSLQITSKSREFLANVKLLLNTMGANGNLQAMKDCWRISISASYMQILNIPTNRLQQVAPSRDARRFLKVIEVVPSGKEDTVFCFTEPLNHAGVFNGVYTGQCGEQPLPPYGACLLGSLNLTQFVLNPFTTQAQINWPALEQATRDAVNMLDAVIDISNFPLEAQREEATSKRRMGIGITGFGDMLAMLCVAYGSEMSIHIADQVMQQITFAAYDESTDLAAKFGPCVPTTTVEQRTMYLEGYLPSQLPEPTKKKILKWGIRNSHLISIAPTGTISLYAGNISSGCEPIFAYEYFRKVLEKDGTKREEPVIDYAVKLYRDMFPNSTLPDYFVNAQTLTPRAHLEIQAALQKWVDSSISKTINLPEDIPFAEFEQVYLDAYDMGCKGCTTYRPNPVTGSIISTTSDKDKAKEDVPKPQSVQPLKRPDILQGNTYKAKWQGNNVYITINDYDDQGKTIPFEIFINSKEVGHFQWTTGLMRMISAIFRRGGDINFVIDELKQTFDPNGGAFYEGKYVPSMVALLGIILEKHLRGIGYNGDLPPMELKVEGQQLDIPALAPELAVKPAQCPQCKDFSLVANSGCPTCTSCGYSKCS